jgi:hypothetical protein
MSIYDIKGLFSHLEYIITQLAAPQLKKGESVHDMASGAYMEGLL